MLSRFQVIWFVKNETHKRVQSQPIELLEAMKLLKVGVARMCFFKGVVVVFKMLVDLFKEGLPAVHNFDA